MRFFCPVQPPVLKCSLHTGVPVTLGLVVSGLTIRVLMNEFRSGSQGGTFAVLRMTRSVVPGCFLGITSVAHALDQNA